MLDLNNKSILITGGTGSFGKAFTRIILSRYPNVKRLAILSRDEQKHFQMAQEFSEKKSYPMGINIITENNQARITMNNQDNELHDQISVTNSTLFAQNTTTIESGKEAVIECKPPKLPMNNKTSHTYSIHQHPWTKTNPIKVVPSDETVSNNTIYCWV